MKHWFLSLIFSIVIMCAAAQEKTEYAVLRYYLISGERCKIELSTNNNIEIVYEGSTSEYGKWARDYDNAAPPLKWLATSDWEPVQFIPPSNANNSTYFFLRRKIK